MTNREYVIKLNKKESELSTICKYHGLYDDKQQDIIQDLYVKLLELNNIQRYELNNEPNMYIIFAILKNLIINSRKRESKYDINEEIKKIDIQDNICSPCEYTDEDYINHKYNYVINEIENENDQFKKTLIKIYYYNNHSLRSLASESLIGINTIQPIIRQFKLKCKNNYKNNVMF